MKSYMSRCGKCTNSSNLRWYHPDDPELKKRVQKITGKREPSEPIVSLLIVTLVVSTIAAGFYAWQVNFAPPASTVAATDSSVPK